MPNIKEIAKISGVSVSTVSRVLNNYPYVSEDKRKAVLDVIERFKYSRNINAVHLIKGMTNSIAVMLPYINHAYFSRIMEGIADGALRKNCRLVFCQTNYNPSEEMNILEMLKMKQFDGIIICSKTLSLKQIEPFSEYGPILACEDVGHSRISSVYLDHYQCFTLALRYLIERGHRHIGFCLGRSNSESSKNRKRAYIDVLNTLDEPVRNQWMFDKCRSIEDGAEVVHRILSMNEKPTALLVTGDQVAAGIMVEARKNGLRVPEDLAIIGFDNQPISRVLEITTIDNQLFEMGQAAFHLLHDHIMRKRNEPVYRELDFRMIERSTV